MITLIHEQRQTRWPDAAADGESLWLDGPAIEAATGWTCKPEGLCRDDQCLPLPPAAAGDFVRDGRLNLAALWRRSGQPVVHDGASRHWVLGSGAAQRGAALASLQAPDFDLPDLDGRVHTLSAYRGRKVFLVTWASWCGCRTDLSAWQSLFDDVKAHGFTVLAVALDQRDAARPWIEAAAPGYPCLIDADHRLAELYNLVNVPQAVWIDEAGRIVRPPETAGSTDTFRAMDRDTLAIPAALLAQGQRVKAQYLDAVREWARRGSASVNALSAERAALKLKLPQDAIAQAHAHFRLAQHLRRLGRNDEAQAQFAVATRLHPDSWAMWRQAAPKNERGIASGAAFWERVDALGCRPYYEPADIAAPPA